VTKLVQRFMRNPKGRDIIVGDVHGCFSLLRAALVRIGFDESGDRLFMVGDLVDRGPESIEALEFLTLPYVHAVQGNHEAMAIEWASGSGMDQRNYVANGGAWMIALDRETQCEVAATLSALPIAIELDTAAGLVGIVHAECPFDDWHRFTAELTAPECGTQRRGQIIDAAMWSRTRIGSADESMVTGVRAVVVGHTPMERMTSLGNTLFIDTMGWRGYNFTMLDADTLQPARHP
jgi:serine/threonine protein phosphatase 1